MPKERKIDAVSPGMSKEGRRTRMGRVVKRPARADEFVSPRKQLPLDLDVNNKGKYRGKAKIELNKPTNKTEIEPRKFQL